ncbi:hypothetical protein [Frigoribacterium sp. PhB160]|uniref:hypothetical protein n=1 Tax=Frigoribacterium sp. PhB160 TaxID=2485192 RepID=UPI0011CE73F5|nr:hypothetical protein [Frigoribacterium sp. PhB160]
MKFDNLSDKAWRIFTGALMWSAENGTDGFIPDRYSKRLHPDGSDIQAEWELSEAGLWEKTRDADGNKGMQLVDWDGALGQSLAIQVETYRANARGRSRRYREKERAKLAKSVGFTDESVTRDVTGDVTSEVRPHVGEGKGKGRGTGDVNDEVSLNEETGEVSIQGEPLWETVAIPSGKKCRVCLDALAADFPGDVCFRQDAAHVKARRARVA